MTPAARIVLDGIDITANLIPAPFGLPLESGGAVIPGGMLSGGPLLSISVTDNEGTKSDSCELEVDNREQIPAPKKGAKLEVWLGYSETGLVFMGSFEVDQWRKRGRPRTLSVSAKAAGLTGDIKSQKSRSFHGKTVKEIVDFVRSKHPALKAIVDNEVGQTKIGHIDQSSESDMAFLNRLARRVGARFKIANRTIILTKAGSGKLPTGDEAPTFVLDEIGETDWDATGAERGDYKSAAASYIDPDTGKATTVVVGEGKPRYRDRKTYKTEDEARTAAQAQIDDLRRGKQSFNCNLPGRPEMFAGAKVQVVNHDPDVDGAYIIKTATHSLDSSGLRTSLACETSKTDEDTSNSDDTSDE